MAIPRFSAALAALALVGVSVFGGATVAANAVAEAPVIVTPTDGDLSVDLEPTISGTIPNPGVEQIVTVTLTNDAGSDVYCQVTVPYTDTTWACGYDAGAAIVPQYGDNTFVATATDEIDPAVDSPESNAVTVTIGGTQTPSILSPAAGATVHDATPAFEGFGPVLGTVFVQVGGEGDVCQADVALSGYWTCDSTIDLPEGGPYAISATAEDLTGALLPGFAGPQDLFYVAPPATPVMTTPVAGTTFVGATNFAGTIAADTVEQHVFAYTDDGTELCEAIVLAGDTAWSCAGTLEVGTQGYDAIGYFDTAGEPDYSNPSATSPVVTVDYVTTTPAPTYGDGAGAWSVVSDAVAGAEPWVVATTGVPDAPVAGPVCTDASCTTTTPEGIALFEAQYHSTTGSDTYSDPFRFYVRTPADPTLDSVTPLPGQQVQLTGTGTIGSVLKIGDGTGPWQCNLPLATTTWSCTLPATPGEHTYFAVQQSQGFDQAAALAAGITDPDVDAYYNGWSNYSATLDATTPSAFGSATYAGTRGQGIALSGTRPANDAAFSVRYETATPGVYNTACTPAQPAASTTWSCTLNSAVIALGRETVTLVVGDYVAGAFVPGTQSTSVLTLAQPTAMNSFAGPGGYIRSSSVVISGTTSYTGGTLSVSGAGAECVAPVLAGTWQCTLNDLQSGEDIEFAVQRTDAGAVIASATASVITPVEIYNLVGGVLTTTSPVTVSGDGIMGGEGTPTQVRVHVTGNGVDTTCTTTVQGEGEGGGGFDCALGALAEGTYSVSAIQRPAWSPTVTSAAVTFTLVVSTSAAEVIECEFAPGALTISSDLDGARVGLYRVDTGDGWTPTNFGTCSGSAGYGFTDTFDDVLFGECPSVNDGQAQPWLSGDLATVCDVSNLTPGIWNLYYSTSDGEGEGGGSSFDWFFVVPEAPVITAAGASTTAAGSVDFSGTAASVASTTGNSIVVRNSVTGATVCETVVAGGTWSCTAAVDGAARYVAYQGDASSAGQSALSPQTASISPSGFPTIVLPGGTTYTVDQGQPLTITGTIDGFVPPGTVIVATLVGADGSETPLTCTGVATWSCTLPASALPSGEYTVVLDAGAVQRDDIVVTVTPTAPVLTGGGSSSIPQGGTVVLTGTKVPGSIVYVTILLPGGGSIALEGCTDTVDGDPATWQCEISNLDLPPGTYELSIRQSLPGGLSDEITPRPTITITGLAPAPPVVPPTPTPSATPGPTPTPAPLVWTFSVGGGEFEPGDETDLVGEGLPVGASVSAEFHSVAVALGSTTVAGDGSFLLHVQIPMDATVGLHHFVVTLTPIGGAPSVVEQAVMISVKPKASGEAPHKSGTGTGAAAPVGAVGSERNDPGAPSSLTRSIPAFKNILANPIVIGAAALAGLALLLLVALPAELLNSTISEQYPRFARFVPKTSVASRIKEWFERVPVVGGLALTVLAAFIFGFTDPGFGFDVTSLRVVLACALALFVVGYLASTISGAIIRRRWGLATIMELKPLGIVLAIVGVIISRLIDFSPGFMLGLILGIAVVGSTTAALRAKTALVQAAVVFVLSMLGWVAYSVLSATTEPDSFMTTLAFDTSVAITTEGLTALFVGLLPFRFLDGEPIFQFNKFVWAGTYVFAAIAFVTIVVPNSFGELDTDVWTWAIVVGIFAVLALGIYAYFRFFAPPIDEESEDEPAREQIDA